MARLALTLVIVAVILATGECKGCVVKKTGANGEVIGVSPAESTKLCKKACEASETCVAAAFHKKDQLCTLYSNVLADQMFDDKKITLYAKACVDGKPPFAQPEEPVVVPETEAPEVTEPVTEAPATEAPATEAPAPICMNKPAASQSTTDHHGVAARAIDGNENTSWGGSSCTHTRDAGHTGSNQPWLQLDYRCQKTVTSVTLVNRRDCCSHRLANFDIEVGDSAAISGSGKNAICHSQPSALGAGERRTMACGETLIGRYVIIRMKPKDRQILTICEMIVN